MFLGSDPFPGFVLILQFDVKIPILMGQKLVGLFPIDEIERNALWPGIRKVGDQSH